MIYYMTHEQIDKNLWDWCIALAPNGNVYAWSWYLDVVHPGWEALVEIKGGKYVSVMPITNKKKYGISYLCQPFFTQQLGVFSVDPLPKEKVLFFLSAIPPQNRLVEIRLNEGNPLDTSCKGVSLHRNHLLKLDNDYDSLYYQYHENTKRNLKKSLKYSLQLVKEVPMQKVIELFRANRGASVKHWGDAEYERLSQLAEVALASRSAFIYGVKTSDNKNVICAALFLFSHQSITFLFSGNDSLGKETQAMSFLIDQVIREYAGQPLTLDFEGSDDENLSRFYQGFGSVQVSYPSFTYRLFNPLR